ncbi:MAG: hypothetical protein ACFFDT_37250 [Candidatus Hodarchaeota archaeon]
MTSQNKIQAIFPSKLKLLTNLTFFWAFLSLLIGLPLFLSNINLPPIENIEHDTRLFNELSLRYLMRFLGIIFTFLGITGLIGSYLISKNRRLGWLILVGLYSSGLVGCFYIVYRVLIFFYRFDLSPWLLIGAISSPITVGILLGVFSLFTLFHKSAINHFFRKIEKAD